MASQAFIYNAIFFTYALVLTKFYGVAADRVGLYILPFAIGNFLGPLLLGPLFDTFGRKPMIAATYALAGILLAVTGQLFQMGLLTATTQTAMWSVVFFFASAAASAAYLTVGRMLSARGARPDHRAVLRLRHLARRRRRTVAVRRADRERRPRRDRLRLLPRRGADGGRGRWSSCGWASRPSASRSKTWRRRSRRLYSRSTCNTAG